MRSLILLSLFSVAASAHASCPPLARYDVSGVSFRGASLDRAVERLLDGTAWKAEFDGPATDIRLSMIGVSGPLNLVLDRLIQQAGKSTVVDSVSSVIDKEGCTVKVNVRTNAPTPSVRVEEAHTRVLAEVELNAKREQSQAEKGYTLPQGVKLSEALAGYAKAHGWSLRWRIQDDYMIDTEIPIPPGEIVDGVLHVIRAYQAAGAMQTVRPRFASPNRVVVIESAGDQ